MSNRALIISLAVALIIGGVLGYVVNNWVHPPPKFIDQGTTQEATARKDSVRDSTATERPAKEVIRWLKGDPYPVHDTAWLPVPSFVYTDSTHGISKDSAVAYQVKHRAEFTQEKIYSKWWATFLVLTHDTTKTEHKTITETKWLPKPWFIDEWFYGSVLGVLLVVLALVTR